MAGRPRNMLDRATRAALIMSAGAVIVLVMANYWVASLQSQKNLENRLDQQLQQMASSLANPLWSFDQTTVRLMGEAFMAGAEAASLEVTQNGSAGQEPVYRRAKAGAKVVVSGQVPVRHEGETIGMVAIGLSGQAKTASLMRLLVTSAGVALVILASVFLLMKSLLARHVAGPLRALGEWTEQVARGDYGLQAADITEAELQPIAAKFTEMSQQVAAREQSLRESEKKFRDLADLLPGIVFESDPTGRLTFLNREGLGMLGYSAADKEAGLTLARLVSPSDQVRFDRDLVRTVNEGGRDGIEFAIVRKDGSRFAALAFISPMHAADRLVGLRGIALDVDRQKDLERQVAQTSKLEAIGTLAGGIAHDFNNMLSAIIGYSELTLENGKLDPEDRENIEAVCVAGERAKDLVRQILTFGRRDGDERAPVQIHTVVEEALSLVGKTIPSTIRIVKEIDAGTGYVSASSTRIHQIVMNLCTNAYHAMIPAGGTLAVSLQAVEAGPDTPVTLGQLASGRYALLQVGDTGAGMTPEVRDKIFDPFFTTKEPGQGTGMGLSVVHGIVGSYGGAIDVRSETGTGTRVQVYLPLTGPGVPGGVLEPDEAAEPGRNERILYVDDDEQLAVLGRRILTALGYEVTEVTSALRARDILLAAPEAFDLVITDQTMPDLTGSELAAEVLRLRPGLPFIICTGYSEVLDRGQVLTGGVGAVLTKPVNMKVLARTVRASLDNPPAAPL